MKDFLRIAISCVASFVLYYLGVIIAGIGLILVLVGEAEGYRWLTLPGIPLLLLGAWIQYKNWGW